MIHDLKKQGLSNTAIARQLGISRRTVTRRLRQGLEVPSYGPRPAKPRLLEPFEGYLRDRVTAWPGLSGRRLFREAKQRGYTGGYSALTNFLREVRPPSVQPYERRFETPPGQQVQVDFAYFEVEFTDAPGVKQVVWLFTMALGYSRFLWGRFCPNQKLTNVLRCHIDAFAELGGAPEEILYDRMKTAVIGEDANGVASLAKAHAERRLEERLTNLAKPRLLIVDELGYLPLEPDAAQLFFQLVSRRYEKGAMLITSNRTISEWGTVFGDTVVATAILDRLLHHSHVVTIRGDSYRLRAKRRSGLLQKPTAPQPTDNVTA